MNEWMLYALCEIRISNVWNSFYLINWFAEQMFEWWWRFVLFFLIFCFSFKCPSLSAFSSMSAFYFMITSVVWLLFVWMIRKSVWEKWGIEWHVISGDHGDINFNIANFELKIFLNENEIYPIICSTNFNLMKIFHEQLEYFILINCHCCAQITQQHRTIWRNFLEYTAV